MNITLQRATIEEDLNTFLSLERSVADSKFYSAILTEEEAKEEFKNNLIFLIKLDDIVVGSIAYETKSPDHVYISGLVVEPKYQGRGIGRAALTMLIDKFADIKRVDLVTHPQNTPALLIYLSLGFVIESWHDNYFGDGEPRVTLAKVKAAV